MYFARIYTPDDINTLVPLKEQALYESERAAVCVAVFGGACNNIIYDIHTSLLSAESESTLKKRCEGVHVAIYKTQELPLKAGESVNCSYRSKRPQRVIYRAKIPDLYDKLQQYVKSGELAITFTEEEKCQQQ